MSKRLANKNHRTRVLGALRRLGFKIEEGRGKNPHTMVYLPHDPRRYSRIPRHPRIKPGLLDRILKQLGVSVDRFIDVY